MCKEAKLGSYSAPLLSLSLNHKIIGLFYGIIGVWGGFLGLGLRFLIRLNYLGPYHRVVSMDAYKYIVTRHGIAMIFMFLMPVLIGGFGNFLLPLLLGMSDLALPRLNSMGA